MKQIHKTDLLNTHQYWKCPNTGRIIWGSSTDNKARCTCGKANPNLPNPNVTEVHGPLTLHFKFALEKATEEEYIAQRKADEEGGR